VTIGANSCFSQRAGRVPFPIGRYWRRVAERQRSAERWDRRPGRRSIDA
jgi:hypothetical protein